MKYLALIILSAAIMVPINAEETCDSGESVTETVQTHLRNTVKSVCEEEIGDLKAQLQVNKAEIIKVIKVK